MPLIYPPVYYNETLVWLVAFNMFFLCDVSPTIYIDFRTVILVLYLKDQNQWGLISALRRWYIIDVLLLVRGLLWTAILLCHYKNEKDSDTIFIEGHEQPGILVSV